MNAKPIQTVDFRWRNSKSIIERLYRAKNNNESIEIACTLNGKTVFQVANVIFSSKYDNVKVIADFDISNCKVFSYKLLVYNQELGFQEFNPPLVLGENGKLMLEFDFNL